MHANYREINPPDDRDPEDYTPAERRAQIFDLIERAGHYRNLQQSYRELGRRFGVSHETIRKDINRVLEWKRENLSPHAEAELETLKTRAVQDLLDRGEVVDAYKIMSEHYGNLQEMGEREKQADKHELSGDAANPLNVVVARDTRTDDGDE